MGSETTGGIGLESRVAALESALASKDEELEKAKNVLISLREATGKLNERWQSLTNESIVPAVFVGPGLTLTIPQVNEDDELAEETAQFYHVVELDGDSRHVPAMDTLVELLEDLGTFEVGLVNGTIATIGDYFKSGDVFPVRRVYEDGTLLVSRHGIDQAMVVERIGLLENAVIKEGDSVAVLPGGRHAFHLADRVDDSVHRYIEPLDRSFNDIGGLTKQKKELRNAIDDYFHSLEDLAAYGARLARGVLLYGPPGNGKTALAKAMTGYLRDQMDEHYKVVIDVLSVLDGIRKKDSKANTAAEELFRGVFKREAPADLQGGLENWLSLYKIGHEDTAGELERIQEVLAEEKRDIFIHLNGPDLLDMWLGGQERRLENVFVDAQRQAEKYGLAVIFVDECEGVLGKRSGGEGRASGRDYMDNLVTKWNGLMDGLEDRGNIFVILASNRVPNIDPAAIRPGRVDLKLEVDAPDRDALKKIFKIYLKEDFVYEDGENAGTLIGHAIEKIHSQADKYNRLGNVRLADGSSHDFYFHDIVSGALAETITNRAIQVSVRRRRAEGGKLTLKRADLEEAIELVREENRHSQNARTINDLGRFKDSPVSRFDPYLRRDDSKAKSKSSYRPSTTFLDQGGR